jgi:hypothetical protein
MLRDVVQFCLVLQLLHFWGGVLGMISQFDFFSGFVCVWCFRSGYMPVWEKGKVTS